MKSMLIIASLIAVAVASPMHRLVSPGMPGPTPIVDETPISVGPALIDNFEPVPVAVGPAVIEDFLPVNPIVHDIASAEGTPLVQIILNINGASVAVVPPSPVLVPALPEVPEIVIPGPVNVVDNVEAPIVPAPVEIGVPALPEIVVPEPVIIGTPIIPAPAVVLPDSLN